MKKICKRCNENLDIEKFYKNKANKDGIHSYCKDCFKKQSGENNKNNKEKRHEQYKKYYEKDKERYVENAKRWNKENEDKKKKNFKKWQQENKDKIKEYRQKHKFHKTHDISNEELNFIYEYSNHSCMYCTITEEESIKKYGQKLHKDHAINDGSNGIDNCILACKGCNSSKHDKDWDIWYKESDIYDKEKFDMIVSWLNIWK